MPFNSQHSLSMKEPDWVKTHTSALSLCVARQVLWAAAGCVGAQRGGWCDSSQQPTEWCPHLGLGVLDLPLAGPARNPGHFDLHADSHYYGARQVK